jgi:DNA-binding NarL/FixJ family response regulator
MIAGELAMSINTGKTHAASIYRRLAVDSRGEAVVRGGRPRAAVAATDVGCPSEVGLSMP